VGLVLAGGGAKGAAHIGVLKMLDSLNFPVDYIAGTSMGGLIGGFYATGYSGKEIETIIKGFDWDYLFNDKPNREDMHYIRKSEDGLYQLSFEIKNWKPVPPKGLIEGQKIMETFSVLTDPVSNIDDFDKLPTPFRCVAIDLITGKAVVLKNGYLPLALRSTMSIPSAFSPVEWGDSLLIDGGLLNNFPVDVAQDMGAEFILGVNVGAPILKRDQLNDMMDVMNQAFNLGGYQKEQENIKLADIVITPDITDFGTGDFASDKVEQIINMGDMAASAFKDSLINLMQQWGLEPGKEKNYFETGALEENITLEIRDIVVLGNRSLTKEEIIAISELDSVREIDKKGIETAEQRLRYSGQFTFAEVLYETKTDSTVKIGINVKEKSKPVIHSLIVHDNKRLSFNFIYSLIGLKPGDNFDPDYLNAKINKLFGLGYFRSIYYTTEPARSGRINLHIWVNENNMKNLRVGLRFNDTYKVIASLALVTSNSFFDGLRSNLAVDLIGITRANWHLSYPSMTLDSPIYPFFEIYYNHIKQNIYDINGKIFANFLDTRFRYGVGLGFYIGKSLNIEAQLLHEKRRFSPSVGLEDYPPFEKEQPMAKATLHFDNLDNAVLPSNGLNLFARYDAEINDDFTEANYHRFEVLADYYLQLNSSNVIKFTGYQAYSIGLKHESAALENNSDFNQFFTSMTPQVFFGMDYYKLRYTQLTMAGIDYRLLLLGSSLYLNLIGNIGLNMHANGIDIINKPFYGYGVGLLYKTISLKFGSKEDTPYQPGKRELWIYFSAGYPLNFPGL